MRETNNKQYLPAINGYIAFRESDKQTYTIPEIFDLIKLNFGYSPVKTYENKHKSIEYKNVSQYIRRKMEGKELPESKPRKTCYSKEDVYILLRYTMYNYLMKKACLHAFKETLEVDVKQKLSERMKQCNFPDKLTLEHIKMSIMMKYFEEKYFEFNDARILEDIYNAESASGQPINAISIDEAISIYNLLGDGKEYYTLKARAKEIFKS